VTGRATRFVVEHFQQYETIWNGQGGTDIFFQNENPYEVPSQAVWMPNATQDGYPACYLQSSVTSFTVFLNGSGGIESVVNGTGAAVSSTNRGPSDVVSAP